jgi:hypothetical protein
MILVKRSAAVVLCLFVCRLLHWPRASQDEHIARLGLDVANRLLEVSEAKAHSTAVYSSLSSKHAEKLKRMSLRVALRDALLQ